MRSLIVVLLALTASQAFAGSMTTIECGDVQASYVDTDLSSQFKNDFLSTQQIAQLKSQGFDRLYAGRNCALGAWDGGGTSFEVLIATKQNHFLIRDYLGSLGIVGATINLSSGNLDLKSGLVLTGKSEYLKNADGSVNAELSLARTAAGDPVVLIIRVAPPLPASPAPSNAQGDSSNSGVEELREEANFRRHERLRAWEKGHPISALFCQGDYDCAGIY